jgi:hypothetical protein
MKNIVVLLAASAVVAYLSPSVHNALSILYVDLLPDLYRAPSKGEGVHGHCNFAQQHVRTVENVHTFGEVKQLLTRGLFGDGWEPVVFKHFLKDPEDKWNSVLEKHQDAEMLFSEVDLKSFGNVFLPGIRNHGKINTTLGAAVSDARQPGNNVSYFASFAPFLDAETSQQILSMSDVEYKSILVDTNFVSNFHRTVLATAIHSAVPINSYSVQLVGRKLWVFLPPNEMESFQAVNVGPTILFSGSEAEMASKNNRYIIAVQEEGDLLFFPPQWGHAVVTKSGFNVMCNVREFAIAKSFFTYPRKVIEGLFAKAYLDGFTAPFNHARMNTAQQKMKSFLEEKYASSETFASPESGCKETWTEMLNR